VGAGGAGASPCRGDSLVAVVGQSLTVPAERRIGSGDWTRHQGARPYLSIGTSLAATVLLGLGAGYWVDRRFGTPPIFFLIGSALGLFAALYQFFKTVNRKP
jgi:F0F1-type ATP synthase assembly protein I